MSPLRPTGWTTTDGATTRTSIITDEWAAQHLPLAQVALAAAVPLIEAEVRERIVAAIEAEWAAACDGWRNDVRCESCRAYRDAARIARGGAQ